MEACDFKIPAGSVVRLCLVQVCHKLDTAGGPAGWDTSRVERLLELHGIKVAYKGESALFHNATGQAVQNGSRKADHGNISLRVIFDERVAEFANGNEVVRQPGETEVFVRIEVDPKR